MYYFYNIFLMSSLTYAFHYLFKNVGIETKLFEKYSVNMMRSLICGSLSYEAYTKYNLLWNDKCLDNNSTLVIFKNYHDAFLSYFILDTVFLFYQVYLKIEKKIRLDLLFHHILAITALLIIENKGLYGLSLMIGLSEGMSFVSGPKLISMEYGSKIITNCFIIYRLLYLIFVRMFFLWPNVLYYYHIITSECDHFKKERNIYLVFFMIMIIMHAEIKWIHSGREELARI
jgi:hypothetical protein